MHGTWKRWDTMAGLLWIVSPATACTATVQQSTIRKQIPMTTIDHRALALGMPAEGAPSDYLNQCAKLGSLYLTSGHTSPAEGRLGDDLTVAEGQQAAREAMLRLLASARKAHGTLEGLRVVRLMGCLQATPDFTEHGEVINGASDLIHELFGPERGHHARSALGFASLPGGRAIEIEAILEVVDG